MSRCAVVASTELPSDQRAAIRRLLDDAFDGRFSDDDWRHTEGGWRVIVFDDDDDPISQAAVVPRTLTIGDRSFHTGYVEGVGTAPAHQRRGLATTVMSEVANVVRQHYELGALSTGLHTFYERQGWERWRGPTFVRDGTRLIRTPDEDHGVMVLRFGPSRAVDLSAPISCEERVGDAW
jgi:aminoglycoside 2'-N-acetyltransferase I